MGNQHKGSRLDYLPDICFAMTLYLATLCIFQIVRVSYSKSHSSNKLTMKPYWLMFYSQAACTIYLIFQLGEMKEMKWPSYVILSIKMGLENLAISV